MQGTYFTRKTYNIHMEKDRLSYLPDPIRDHIVSFLPTKDAIRTSILSRQWENVCSSLSNMEFNKATFKQTDHKVVHFRNSIDRLLFRHDGSDIRRFSLKTGLLKKFQKFPSSFYTCSSLTVLSLISIKFKCPSFVQFPMLKSFHLEDVSFLENNTINKLVSSCTCPVLEELEITFCDLSTIKSLSISIPSLKYLKLLEWNCSLKRAPTISSETLLSLVTAYFEFTCSLEDEAAKDFLIINRKIVEGLHNVQELGLYDNFIEKEPPCLNINNTEEYLQCKELPSADILNCLRTVKIKDFEGSEGELELLRYLLQNAKHLEMVYIIPLGAEQIDVVNQLSTSERVAPNVTINWIKPEEDDDLCCH
ncbi:hypothetical protein AQUCO_01500414v1 [Aquilegia coerulea]|uniref:F-box domain-containing protein n=1 Tax=Aquilegia coerulea TaxID=218851 RepID=A0A2G5DTJ9_AQUCA|nr:hypothetical protein AQUCO_01500414v1 [Aquilegia coerulea]